jgi:long-chain acyl-CoA synthetase
LSFRNTDHTGMPETTLETLDQLVESFSHRGDVPAIIAFGRKQTDTLGYSALSGEIQRVATGLQQRGLGVGDQVILWAPNSAAWAVTYFGIVGCGATAVPLDAQANAERAMAVLRHSRAALIVTVEAHARSLARSDEAVAAGCMLLDGDPSDPRHWQRLATGPLQRPPADPARVASLIYTSGTTGTPKAVPLTHGNLAANVRGLLAAELIDSSDVVLVPLPFHHVYPFTAGLLTVLATGARIVLPAGISGPEITRAARESGATTLLAVPRLCAAIWEGLESGVRSRGRLARLLFTGLLAVSSLLRRTVHLDLGRFLFRSVHRRIGAGLTTIGCGGAQLDADLARKLEALGWTVLTGYGLTETSPVLTFNQHGRRRLGTEGLALSGVELRILPHAEYEHGEILARGPNVFTGYWNNPEDTKSAFTADGWFKTGDLGWIDRRGYLHIAGRSKEVIVLPDGKNVFPDEIEEAFKASALINEIAVLEQDGRLHALLVPDERTARERGTQRIEALIKEEVDTVLQSLPPYQRLSDYRITRTPLPRTPLGKLQRHLLAEAYAQAGARNVETSTTTIPGDDRALLDATLPAKVWAFFKARYPDRTITLDTSPQLDLHIDSLEWVTLTLEFERRFGFSLAGDAISRIVTLRDLLREIEAAPASGERSASARSVQKIHPPGGLLYFLGTALLALNRGLMRAVYRLEVIGRDTLPSAEESFVIAPNHASYLDPPAVGAALPPQYLRNVYWAGWVGKLYAGPLSRLLSRSTRVFPVDPDRDPGGALTLGASVLEQRRILVWFPEGRRSFDGGLQHFQAGIGLLIADSKARAVPTAILGTYEAWSRHQRYPGRGRIRVIFGPPMSRDELIAAGHGDSDAERIADGLRAAMAALIAQHTPASAPQPP